MATLRGRTVGGYLIEEELGRGAMGVVFKAKQLSMDRYVALKFLPNRLAQDEKVVARFLREARAAGQLSHPNIVGVHDAGVMEGLHFIAMEFVDGNSVYKRLEARGPYSERETLDIAGQIAEALRVAHGRGILHRDIKPDNFLIDSEGRVRLADLGLARFQPDGKKEAELTQDGTAMGTPNYMSPEQCAGNLVDARSDLYSLGASMFVMSTGDTPFQGNSGAAVMVKVMTEAPRSLKSLNPTLSPGFVALVERMMAKDPAKRFQDAQQVIDAIEKCKAGNFRAPSFQPRPASAKHTRIGSTEINAPIPVVESKIKPLLIGAAAGVLALIAGVWIMSRSNPTQATQASVPFNPAPAQKIEPAPPKTAPVDPPPDTQKAVPPAMPDLTAIGAEAIKRRDAALKKLNEFIQEHQPVLHHNPALVRVHYEDFIKDHPHIKLNLRARQYSDEIDEAEARLKRDQDTVRDTVLQDIKQSRWLNAIEELLNFEKAYPGSDAARTCHVVAMQFSKRLQTAAQSEADAGKFDDAIAMLNTAVDKLPPGFDDNLKNQITTINAQREKAKTQIEENKKFTELVEKAAGIAKEFDSISGKRYRFDEAAQYIRGAKDSIKSPGGIADANALLEIYTHATRSLERMRLAITGLELELLKTKGRIISWDEKGLTFEPEDEQVKSQTQLISWKGVTPENLIHIAQALKFWSKDTPEDNLELGILSFAAGYSESFTVDRLQRAEVKFKDIVDTPLRLFKASGHTAKQSDPNRESAAKQEFETALAAREKRDMDTIRKTSIHLQLEYADTEFVQSHSKQIQDLNLPFPAVAAVPSKDSDVDKEKKDAAAKETSDAVIADLRKLGWEEGKGSWTEPQKGIFAVKDGELNTKLSDGAIQVTFQLEPGASIGIYARYEPDIDIAKNKLRKIENTGSEVGRGYGFLIENSTWTAFGSKQYASGPLVRRVELPEIPIKVSNYACDNTKPHVAQVTVHGDKLDLKMDDRPWITTDTHLRKEGTIHVVVEGSARLSAPVIMK